jgi:two-component system response regulator HydG
MATEITARVLIVDDELEMARTLADGLCDHGFDAVAASSGRAALALLSEQRFDALVTDLRMPEMDGLTLMAQSRLLAPERPTLIMTAHGAIDSAIESIRQGAYHYLTKPFKLDELVIFVRRAIADSRLRREADALRTTLRERFGRAALVGHSAPMRALFDTLERVAASDVPLLIGGETGTGKGLFARIVHAESRRAGGPFVEVNCAALPEGLLESELFGHEKGAFTGAARSRRGLFAQADGGTLFLDEIGDIPHAIQVKLLHVLEEGMVRPVGSDRASRIDVRVVAATHRDLRRIVQTGGFREDLFYRLDVVSLQLPPLRQRREDIPFLVDHFLREQRSRHPQSKVERFSAEAMKRLLDYDWPGNVRELSHVVERALVLSRGSDIQPEDLPPALSQHEGSRPLTLEGEILPIRTVQRRYAAWALAQCGGLRTRAADKLGVDVKTLYNWLSDTRPED